MIKESEYNQIIGKLMVNHVTHEELSNFLEIVSEMEGMLDEADGDDYFGTEGWRHRLGWD